MTSSVHAIFLLAPGRWQERKAARVTQGRITDLARKTSQVYRHDLRPAFSPATAAVEEVNVALTIRAVELYQSAAAIIEEQRPLVSVYKKFGNDVRPALGIGSAGELADAASIIYAVELCQSAAAIIEEQRPPDRNDVRPALGVGGAGELADSALRIYAVELCQPATAIIEEQRPLASVYSAYKKAGNDVCPAFGGGSAGELADAASIIHAVELCQPATAIIEEQRRPDGNDVRPALGVGGAGELADAASIIYAVGLCCSCIAIIEEYFLSLPRHDVRPACPPTRVACHQVYVALAIYAV